MRYRMMMASSVENFPTIVGALASFDSTLSTSHTLSFPGGTTVAGELLIALLVSGNNATPSGWTLLVTGPLNVSCVVYKIASGSEGSTLTFTTGTSRVASGAIYRISGYLGTPEAQTSSTAGANPDPPSLTVSWGIKKTLWLAACGSQRTIGSPAVTVTGYPSTFSGGITAAANTGGGGSNAAGVASLNDDTTATVNPGTFTLNSATPSSDTYTIGVRGA